MAETGKLELWLQTIEIQKSRVKIRAKAKESGLEGHHIAILRALQEFGMVKKVHGGHEVHYELTPLGRSVPAILNKNQTKLPEAVPNETK